MALVERGESISGLQRRFPANVEGRSKNKLLSSRGKILLQPRKYRKAYSQKQDSINKTKYKIMTQEEKKNLIIAKLFVFVLFLIFALSIIVGREHDRVTGKICHPDNEIVKNNTI